MKIDCWRKKWIQWEKKEFKGLQLYRKKRIVKIKATQILIKAVLYNPFIVSITIWVIEKTKYINAGVHNSENTITYIIFI